MEKLLVIYDTDVFYAGRLMDYMKKSPVAGFELLLFTKRDSLCEFLKDHVVELLLMGEGMQEELPQENLRYILRLTGEKPANQQDLSGTIYKYQNANGVIKDMLTCYTKAQGIRSPEREEELKIISVFAPGGGSREAAYGWYLALSLAERKKVLYLPLEQLPVSLYPASAGKDQALSEFIYFLKENPEQLTLKLPELLQYSGKLAYLSGVAHGLDLLSLGKGDVVRLAELLKAHTDYEAVICYLGMYTEFSIELMRVSNSNYFLGDGSAYSESTIKEWDRQMALSGVDTGAGKFHRIGALDCSTEEGSDQDSPEGIRSSRIWQLVKQSGDI